MKSHVIGLTGQSGAGKTTVSRIFSENGFFIIDADIVAREVVEKGSPCLAELAECFGSGILNEDGTLDRKALGKIVFSDKQKLKSLDSLCYPYIFARIVEIIKERERDNTGFILIDAPTLFEANVDELCELVISVTAREEIRKNRIMQRDGITEEDAKRRFSSQHSESFFVSHSDFVIKNNKTSEILVEKSREVATKIKEYCNGSGTEKA